MSKKTARSVTHKQSAKPMPMRKRRRELELTQAFVADKLGVTQSTYSDYETGEILPTADKLRVLAELFGVTVDYLLGVDPVEYQRALNDGTMAKAALQMLGRDLSPTPQSALAAFTALMATVGDDPNRLAVVVQKLHALNQELNKS